MFKKVFNSLWIWFVLLGFIIYAFGIYTAGISILQQNTIEYGSFTWTYYTIDTHSYLSNLQQSLEAKVLLHILPIKPELPTTPNYASILQILKFIANTMLIYVGNWIIYALNCIYAVIKIILYPIQIIYTLLGIDTTSNDWVSITETIYTSQIPYIPFI